MLYGIDTDADGLPNKFVAANEVNQLDGQLIPAGASSAAMEAERKRKTYWKKVVAIKLGLLVRGSQKSRTDTMKMQYDLFGPEYSNTNSNDIGARIKEEELRSDARNRIRKVFQQTNVLRNRPVGDGA